MAEWIKLRSDLDTDPRVFSMGEFLRTSAQPYILTAAARDLFGDVTNTVTRNAMRDVTVAALCRVWFAANRHTTDGIFKNATLDYLDTLAQVPGFGAAMAHVGYAIHDPATGTVTLPRFEEYNAPDKNGQRSKTAGALRMAKHRAKKAAEEAQAAQNIPAKHSESSESLAKDEPKKKESDGNSDVTGDVTASSSISESGTQNPETKPPTPPPDPDPLGTLKKRINALRPCWAKAPHWNAEEDHALFESMHNLLALPASDWQLLAWFFRWANSAANTASANPVSITTKRKTLISELASYLDRASTAHRQAGRPKFGSDAGTPARKPSTPPPAPVVIDQTPEEAKQALESLRASFDPGARLLEELGIPTKPAAA